MLIMNEVAPRTFNSDLNAASRTISEDTIIVHGIIVSSAVGGRLDFTDGNDVALFSLPTTLTNFVDPELRTPFLTNGLKCSASGGATTAVTVSVFYSQVGA